MEIPDAPNWVKNAIALVALVFTVYLFMDARHASNLKVELLRSDTVLKDLRSQYRDNSLSLKANAEARDYFEKLEKSGDAVPADLERLGYLEEKVPVQQARDLELEKEIRELERALERQKGGE